ncbi:hypothetical protein BDV95DRAFT_644000 [Massariosphaeria phaeospora]|uniref:Uncharacterized protein n=1 Tax=Massariosphaeria phaeospora TaxID=100035 RepID=A0A7C8MMM6_9PLEO|nr:hypothetical protein BDV95DRAFT_644000 [Massariosphaeria phaeospora]
MASPIDVLYYGDQSVEPFVSIEELVGESQKSELLDRFLHSVFKALTLEVASLPSPEKDLFSGSSFGALATLIRSKKTQNVAVSTVFSCVAQLGWTIVHREKYPERWSGSLDRALVGVCTGSLAAIAAIVARSETDLLRLAPEFALLALRLGIEVSRRSLSLENSSEPWSVAVTRVSREDLEAALDAFNRSQNIPAYKRVYISAQSSAGITLSGPPTILQSFFENSQAMKAVPKLTMPIYGSFHASHLPLPNVEGIVGNSEFWKRPITGDMRKSLLLPSSTGEDQNTLHELLISAVTDILQNPIDFESLVKRTQSKTQGKLVRFASIGPAHTGALKRALTPTEIERFGSLSLPSSEQLSPKDDYKDAIAIVGMACRLPEAQTLDEFWEVLMQGRDLHRQIPPDRFDVATHYDPSGKIPNTSITQWGCFDDNIAQFDLSLFKMSPREAIQTDPCHRMMLITGYEALEAAGYYDPGSPRPKFGTFYGQAGDDYRMANSGQNVDTNYITGGIRAFAPGRVSYFFGWEGPSMSVDTACSSSAVAIHQACSSLHLRESDMALAGGANLLTSSDFFAGLSRARFVSTTGPCKTFDENADGYCRADGAGSVVLKRYEDAIRDKDNILGVIRSIETGHAGTAISITHPDADHQYALFSSVLAKVGMDAQDIDHVEMHGTGTQAGDLAETSSVARLLQAANRPRPNNQPLTIASVKPNVGHSEGASGVTSLIKAILMMKHRVNPRHIGIKTKMNPKLPPLADLGIIPPLEHRPYVPIGDKARMLVNNFNATGGATTMVLEEHTPNQELTIDPRGYYPIVISAATQKSLTKAMSRLLDHLKAEPDVELSHLSYTLTARRLHHSYGFSCVASGINDLVQQLQSAGASPSRTSITKRGALKSVVFAFTGQAVSHIGMAKTLYRTNDIFRGHLVQSDALCRNMDLPSFLEVIDNDSSEDLSRYGPTKAQLALVALEVALAHLFSSWGIRPVAVMGHSLGEYSALCVSQALSVADTLYLVGRRAQLMESLCRPKEYAMIATSLSAKDAQKHLAKFDTCQVACLNGPSQTVISGPDAAIDDLSAYLERQSVKIKKLPVDYAFHSAQMDPLLSQYERIADGVSFHEPKVPLVSTYLGRAANIEDLNPRYVCQQTRQAVKFQEAVETLDLEYSPLWIELGPAPTCSQFISLITGTRNTVAALDPRKPNWRTISDVVTKHYLAHGDLRWDEFHKQYLDSLRLVQTPSYSFDMTKQWIQYEGNWGIIKNHGPTVQAATTSPPTESLISSTLTRLESASVNKDARKLVFSSDLKGHRSPELGSVYSIGNATFTAGSIFVDMALTAASELWKRVNIDVACPVMEVASLELLDGVQLGGSDGQLKLTATQQPFDESMVQITISNVEAGGKSRDLAKCKVIYGDNDEWTADADVTSFLYQSRMDLLEMVHKSTSGLSTPASTNTLQSIQELILAPGTSEAVARIVLQASQGDFKCDPQWSNAILQLSSFVLAREDICYLLSGWQALRVLRPLQSGTQYRCHIRVQQDDATGSMTGNLHVFDSEGRPVAKVKNIRYQAAGRVNKPLLGKPKVLPQVAWSDTQTTTVPMKQSSESTVDISQVLSVLASELGINVEALDDQELLEDMGVDSIMGMTLLAKMQESFTAKLPSQLLVEQNSFGKLKTFFGNWSALQVPMTNGA